MACYAYPGRPVDFVKRPVRTRMLGAAVGAGGESPPVTPLGIAPVKPFHQRHPVFRFYLFLLPLPLPLLLPLALPLPFGP